MSKRKKSCRYFCFSCGHARRQALYNLKNAKTSLNKTEVAIVKNIWNLANMSSELQQEIIGYLIMNTDENASFLAAFELSSIHHREYAQKFVEQLSEFDPKNDMMEFLCPYVIEQQPVETPKKIDSRMSVFGRREEKKHGFKECDIVSLYTGLSGHTAGREMKKLGSEADFGDEYSLYSASKVLPNRNQLYHDQRKFDEITESSRQKGKRQCNIQNNAIESSQNLTKCMTYYPGRATNITTRSSINNTNTNSKGHDKADEDFSHLADDDTMEMTTISTSLINHQNHEIDITNDQSTTSLDESCQIVETENHTPNAITPFGTQAKNNNKSETIIKKQPAKNSHGAKIKHDETKGSNAKGKNPGGSKYKSPTLDDREKNRFLKKIRDSSKTVFSAPRKKGISVEVNATSLENEEYTSKKKNKNPRGAQYQTSTQEDREKYRFFKKIKDSSKTVFTTARRKGISKENSANSLKYQESTLLQKPPVKCPGNHELKTNNDSNTTADSMTKIADNLRSIMPIKWIFGHKKEDVLRESFDSELSSSDKYDGATRSEFYLTKLRAQVHGESELQLAIQSNEPDLHFFRQFKAHIWQVTDSIGYLISLLSSRKDMYGTIEVINNIHGKWGFDLSAHYKYLFDIIDLAILDILGTKKYNRKGRRCMRKFFFVIYKKLIESESVYNEENEF